MKCPICNCRLVEEPVHTFAGAELEHKCPLCGRRYELQPDADGRAVAIVARLAVPEAPKAVEPEPEKKSTAPQTTGTNHGTPWRANLQYRPLGRNHAVDDHKRWNGLPVEEQRAIIATVKARLKAAGITYTALAASAGVNCSSVTKVWAGGSYGIGVRTAAAHLLGVPYHELWTLPAAAGTTSPAPSAEAAGPASPPLRRGDRGDLPVAPDIQGPLKAA